MIDFTELYLLEELQMIPVEGFLSTLMDGCG
jgi:hypothetical protein